eukprot:CAMPEP_0113623002 /NCGR_PEP_ID=MMETSP0017_2-20120614/11820_1 /TAXON_ID=2856 /ORGANISM="Cylindrotheca closterium" /LENGTH=111 /DNA_ID=CAMNT_0000532913 /DNA_START=17 /DNA_END=352 /DNA_ORIENTATION=+ /assembly_acc=CAM_ASM_000147
MDGDGRDMANVDSSAAEEKAHCCEVKIAFPTNLQAQQAMQVLAVDPEPTNRVAKQFRISQEADDKNNQKYYMVVRFESKELKMLRVAVSSFYDYLALVIKTMQEFDTSMGS